MLDFRMETFIAVCESMNYTKAAEKLSITQPAVSQHIRFLEESYEAKLFEFRGKKPRLTEAGELLLNTVLTMKHDELHLKQQIKEGLEKNRELSFGATLTVGEFLMPQAVAQYIKDNENTSLRMLIANTKELLEKLDAGAIDFAVVEGYFAKNQYDHRLYSTENYIAVCAPKHRFEKKPRELKDLFGETVITREQGSGTREILEKTLESRNYVLSDFKRRLEISNINTIKHLTAKDCGITFLYEVAVKKELESGMLRKIPLQDVEVKHDMTFIWRKNSIFADYYCQLFEILKKN